MKKVILAPLFSPPACAAAAAAARALDISENNLIT
jgi:hypothetical protein